MGMMKRALLEEEGFDPHAAPEASVKAHADLIRATPELATAFDAAAQTLMQVKHVGPNRASKILGGIADAFTLPRGRSLADFLVENEELRLQAQSYQVSGRSLTGRDLENLIRDGILKRSAPKPPEAPLTVERLMEQAREVGYTEIYVAFRHRDSTKIGPDRLEDAIDIAPTLEEACAKAIRLAGYRDKTEIEELGLDQFDAGTAMELCARLEELTGDRFEISPFETPSETPSETENA